MPAEIALAITGLVLAWKGIVDFGQLVGQFTDDDLRQRRVLYLIFEAHKFELEEWVRFWGVDRDDGRFHDLERPRQEFIKVMIKQLEDSATQALKLLTEKYRMADVEQTQQSDQPERRFSKVSARVTTAIKRGKDKSQWIIMHQEITRRLAAEVKELLSCLKGVATISSNFFGAHIKPLPTAPRLQSRLVSVVEQVMQAARDRKATSLLSQDGSDGREANDVDQQTLAGLATQFIPSSRQADCVRKHLESAFDRLGDTRIVENVAEWWNEPRTSTLVLETAADAEDQTCVSACVLLYFLVDCHKLIYVFDAESDMEPAQHMFDMLRTLIQTLLPLRGAQPLSANCQQGIYIVTHGDDMSAADPFQLITVVFALLHDVLASSQRRILLIIVGLEMLDLNGEDESCQLMQSFVSRLGKLCEADDVQHPAHFKALFGCKGHATELYDCGENVGVADLTDRTTRVTALGEELAASLDASD